MNSFIGWEISGGHRFNDMHARRRGRNAREPEPGSAEQHVKLLAGAFQAAGQDEHVDIHEFREAGAVVGRNQFFDDEEAGLGRHGAAHGREDAAGVVVVPVVQDVRHHVGIGTGRHGREKIPGFERAAIRYAGRAQRPAGGGDDVRSVEQHGAQARVSGEDESEKLPVAAAHIDHALEDAEVIRFFTNEASRLHGLRKVVVSPEKTAVLDVNGDGIEYPGLTYGNTVLEALLRYLGVVFNPRVLHDPAVTPSGVKEYDLSARWTWGHERVM